MTPYTLVFQYDPFDADSRLKLATPQKEVETYIIPTNSIPALVEKIEDLDKLYTINRICIAAPPFYYAELQRQVPNEINKRMEQV